MRIIATIRIALRALRRNKMRSLLTMLGIIIGVGSVITAVSLTTGATKQVESQVQSLGESVLTVFSGNQTSGGTRGGWGSAPTLTVEDAMAIAKLLLNKGAPNLCYVISADPDIDNRELPLDSALEETVGNEHGYVYLLYPE